MAMTDVIYNRVKLELLKELPKGKLLLSEILLNVVDTTVSATEHFSENHFKMNGDEKFQFAQSMVQKFMTELVKDCKDVLGNEQELNNDLLNKQTDSNIGGIFNGIGSLINQAVKHANFGLKHFSNNQPEQPIQYPTLPQDTTYVNIPPTAPEQVSDPKLQAKTKTKSKFSLRVGR